MRPPYKIEDIEGMRRSEGIDDVQLRQEIRQLRVGDFVRLTLLSTARPSPGETLLVRVTSISGSSYRGKLESRPRCASLSEVRAGTRIAFTRGHIHSVRKAGRAGGRSLSARRHERSH